MQLSTLLRDLATLYRRYGDVPVVIETPHHIYQVTRVDDDVWNIENNVTAVIETEQVDNPTPEIPTREKSRPRNSRKRTPATNGATT